MSESNKGQKFGLIKYQRIQGGLKFLRIYLELLNHISKCKLKVESDAPLDLQSKSVQFCSVCFYFGQTKLCTIAFYKYC